MRNWYTPSPHRDHLFCPDCMGALSQAKDWQAQVYQACHTCGWNNRPTFDEWIERLRTEYQNHPEKYEGWERGIIEETLQDYDSEKQ